MDRLTLRPILLAVYLLVAMVVGYTAGARFTADTAVPGADAAQRMTFVTTAAGAISEEYAVSMTVRWPVVANLVYAGPAGIVTSTQGESAAGGIDEFQVVDQGETLISVDALPIVMADGEYPAYRTLEQGLDGPDIAQFQRLLSDEGYFDGALDGHFDDDTASAAEDFWLQRGVAHRRSAPLGSVVFVANLPRRVALSEDVIVGHSVGHHATLLHVFDDEPSVALDLTDVQRQRYFDAGADFLLSGTSYGDIPLEVLEAVDNEGTASTVLSLGVAQDIVLDSLSPQLGLDQRLSGRMIVVPLTAGTVLPLSALRISGGSTDAAVVLASGEQHSVRVMAVVGGEAVVDGISAGVEVAAG